jgi:hypothetical protein
LNRLQRYYERREVVVDMFFDLADAIITVRSGTTELLRLCGTSERNRSVARHILTKLGVDVPTVSAQRSCMYCDAPPRTS